MKEIYDVITKQTICFSDGQFVTKCQEIGAHYVTILAVLNKKCLYACCRYILPENKNKIFILVDVETGQEYDCISNKTLLWYFKNFLPSEVKIVHNLTAKRTKFASICGRVFYLKTDIIPSITKIRRIKNGHLSEVISVDKKNKKFRKSLTNKLRKRIWSAVHAQKTKKFGKTEQLIGCSIQFLIGYLESKFHSGMSWQNYGEWHIDHIRPCASFDLTDSKQQQQCFHYTNLQPLWARENLSKGIKF